MLREQDTWHGSDNGSQIGGHVPAGSFPDGDLDVVPVPRWNRIPLFSSRIFGDVFGLQEDV